MRTVALFLAACALFAPSSGAQEKRVSPHEKTSATVGKATITVEYGRPYLKGRKAVGGALVPYGKVWRTGADEATTLTTTGDIMIGDLAVSAGTYALFTLPSESGWKLIVSKNAKQWGAFSYKESEDLGRVNMAVKHLSAPVEQFTISLDAGGGNRAVLKMAWEQTEVTAPIVAK